MKKFVMLSLLVMMGVSCSVLNKEVVEYNKERLNHIEEYLESGDYQKVNSEEKYRSLEREAEAWKESQINQ